MGSADDIRLVIASGVRLYRDGLARLLADHERVRVVATDDAHPAAAQRIASAAPDVTLVDPMPPDRTALIRCLRAAAPRGRIVALGVSGADIVSHARAGADGFLPREASLAELLAAIDAARRGETTLCADLATGLVAFLASERSPAGDASRRLTPREREIVALIARDLSNKEIAAELCIELPTVKNHVHNVLEKLSVSRRADAVAVLEVTEI